MSELIFDATVRGVHVRLYRDGKWSTVSEEGNEVDMDYSFPKWALAAYLVSEAAEIAALRSKLAAAMEMIEIYEAPLFPLDEYYNKRCHVRKHRLDVLRAAVRSAGEGRGE